MAASALFTAKSILGRKAPNRIVMSSMTRCRVSQPGGIPNQLMAEYYAQRAGAGAIICEGTCVSSQARGHSSTPGIYTPQQENGWSKVVKAVQKNTGRIFLQLLHAGRVSHSILHGGEKPVAPSAVGCDAQVWIEGPDSIGRMEPCSLPRTLTKNEIQVVIEDFVRASEAAMRVGFDGVEIQGGDGYLLDQFLRRSSNYRSDHYGGVITDRIRFPTELINAISAAIGSENVGVRLTPFLSRRNMEDTEAVTATLIMAREFDRLGVGYIHLGEASETDVPRISDRFRQMMRRAYEGIIVVSGNYTSRSATDVIRKDLADFVSFGRNFISNPDLPYRLQNDLPLNALANAETILNGGARGYTDYPTYNETNRCRTE